MLAPPLHVSLRVAVASAIEQSERENQPAPIQSYTRVFGHEPVTPTIQVGIVARFHAFGTPERIL